MANEVKITFIGDPSPLFNTVEDVNRRLRTVGMDIQNVERFTYSRQNFNPREIPSSIKTIDEGLAKAVEGRIKQFTFELERRSLVSPITRLPASGNPLKPSIDERLAELAKARLPERALLPQGPVSPRETSFAKDVAELAPKIKAAREDQEKIGMALEKVVGLRAEESVLLTKSLGLSSAMIGSIGVMSAIGAAAIGTVYWITTDIRAQAEKRLALEERIAGVYGKQNKELFDARKHFQESLRLQQESFALESRKQSLQTYAPEQLRSRIATLTKLVDLNPVGENAERLRKELLMTAALLNDIEKKAESTSQSLASRLLNLSYNGWKAEQEAARKREAQRIEDFNKAKTRIEDLGKTWRDTFDKLAVLTSSDNPIARVVLDSNRAITELRENIRGLPKELQDFAIAAQRTFNANQLFAARADSVLSAFDLRDMAGRFRDTTADRRGVASRGLDRDRLEFDRMRSLGAGINTQAWQEWLNARQTSIDRMTGENPSDRLERQLRELNRLDPQNTGERSIIDQRILRIAGGIDPAQLTRDLREGVAQSAEREAVRVEMRFQEAMGFERQKLKSLQAIEAHGKRLLERAERDGIAGVEIYLKDETRNGVSTNPIPRTPDQRDVDRTYSLGSAGGAGGFTNL